MSLCPECGEELDDFGPACSCIFEPSRVRLHPGRVSLYEPAAGSRRDAFRGSMRAMSHRRWGVKE